MALAVEARPLLPAPATIRPDVSGGDVETKAIVDEARTYAMAAALERQTRHHPLTCKLLLGYQYGGGQFLCCCHVCPGPWFLGM